MVSTLQPRRPKNVALASKSRQIARGGGHTGVLGGKKEIHGEMAVNTLVITTLSLQTKVFGKEHLQKQ